MIIDVDYVRLLGRKVNLINWGRLRYNKKLLENSLNIFNSFSQINVDDTKELNRLFEPNKITCSMINSKIGRQIILKSETGDLAAIIEEIKKILYVKEQNLIVFKPAKEYIKVEYGVYKLYVFININGYNDKKIKEIIIIPKSLSSKSGRKTESEIFRIGNNKEINMFVERHKSSSNMGLLINPETKKGYNTLDKYYERKLNCDYE